MQPLAITRYSVVNCLGAGVRAVGDALFEGRSRLAPCDFDSVALDTYIGRVRDIEARPVRASLRAYDCRNNRMAQLALELDGFAGAVAQARERYGAARIGVFLGTSTSGILETELAYQRRAPATGALPADYHYAETHNPFSLADFVQRYLDLHGPALVVSAACSSSAKVFGNAARMIAAGVCDAAVVGGIDTLCLTTLYGFHSLELTSRGPCRPFDAARNGISIGEGGGFALLERAGGGARLLGVGDSCDAYHMSTPHPEALMVESRRARWIALALGVVFTLNLVGAATSDAYLETSITVDGIFGIAGAIAMVGITVLTLFELLRSSRVEPTLAADAEA